jgi:hypothetical protein
MLSLTTKLTALALVFIASSVPSSSQDLGTARRRPAAAITLSVGENSRSELVQRIETFAKNENFKIRTASLQNYPENVYAELWRDDASIVVVNLLNSPIDFSVFVYDESNARSPAHIDSIVKSLKSMIVGIPGVTITSMK